VRLSRLERFLRVFTEVREGEGATALLLFANVFLILCAYYFIKPLREGWISISEVAGLTKMEVKAYSSFGQSLLLIFVVMAYTRLSSRWPRRTLITRSTLFCMSNMVVFWVLQPGFFLEHLPGTGIAFYLWVGMFGVFVVAQFWAFVADLYTQERGHRLLPMVAIGATAGAVFGSWVSGELVHSQELMKKSLLIVALLPLAASILLTRWADRRGPLGQGHAASRAEQPAAGSRRDALMLVLRSRYLLPVACATLLVNWVNTNGENLLFHVLQDSLAAQALASGIVGQTAVLEFTKDGTTAFYADFFFWVNAVALVLQALVASRLLKYGGFGAILMLLPMIALLSYATMALLPVLVVVKIMKIAENSTDYSINNTARHVLWLPLPAEMVYKGKAAVETLFVRLGDGLAALTVLVGVEVLALTTQGFFAFTVALVLIWIWLSVVVVREHRRVSGEARVDLGEGRPRGSEVAR
jgi:AAA family ATP:ADP antiporter